MRYFISLVALLGLFISIEAQTPLSKKETFTRQDTLRGSITPEREWWDVTYYHLDIKVDPEKKFISGKEKDILKNG